VSSFRWQTEREGAVTLDALRAFVAEVSTDLDPGSRYVSELLAVLDASADVGDYMRRLQDPARVASFQRDGAQASTGERGRSWVDDQTWAGMDPFERTLSNLLTGETRMMWGAEGAPDFAALADVLSELAAPRAVLSIPCSTGKEPFSIAIAALRAGVELTEIVGVDRQDAYLERARSGRLVPHHRDLELEGVEAFLEQLPEGRVRASDAVQALCRFEQGDVLTGRLPAGPFALVSCRNLLGYFRGKSLQAAASNVIDRVRPGGALLLDPFVTESDAMAPVRALLAARGFARRAAATCFYAAPA
jgi:chemotaxis methyl-accepting protein methylase